MIPGIMAGQMMGSGAGLAGPQLRAFEKSTFASASSVSVTLPAGWQIGDLCIIMDTFANTNNSAADPSGWTRLSRGAATGLATITTRYKILAASEPAPTIFTSSSAPCATLVYVFKSGTFNAATPLAASGSLSFSTSTTLTYSAGGVSHPAGNHLAMYSGASADNALASVSSHAGALLAESQIVTNGSLKVIAYASFAAFTSGLSPAGTLTLNTSATNRGHAQVIIGP